MSMQEINIYQRFVEMINDDYLFYSQDLDGKISFMSSNVESFFGVLPEDIIGRKWYEVLSTTEEMVQRARDSELFTIHNRIPAPYELEFFDSENNVITLEIQENPVLDTNNKVVAIDGIAKNITSEKLHATKLETTISHLNSALEEINTLKGILPICSSCKKVRDDSGYWRQIESYITLHSEAEFSHSICPECVKKLYPDMDLSMDE